MGMDERALGMHAMHMADLTGDVPGRARRAG